jgi:hypothetical protein
VEGVVEVGQSLIEAGGGLIDFGGILHAEGFVRALMIKDPGMHSEEALVPSIGDYKVDRANVSLS